MSASADRIKAGLALLAAALLLHACDAPAPRKLKLAPVPVAVAADAPPPPLVPLVPTGPVHERAGPVTWNSQAGAFEFKGQKLRAEKLWVFDGTTDGFVMTHGDVTPADKGAGVSVAETGADSAIRSPSGLNVDGHTRSMVIVRLTRVRPGKDWDGSVHYTTPAHGESEQYLAKGPKSADPALNETVTLLYDMTQLRRGDTDWRTSIIDQIRIDFDDAAGGAFVIHQVAIAQDPGGVFPPPPPPPPPEAAKPDPAAGKPAQKPTTKPAAKATTKPAKR